MTASVPDDKKRKYSKSPGHITLYCNSEHMDKSDIYTVRAMNLSMDRILTFYQKQISNKFRYSIRSSATNIIFGHIITELRQKEMNYSGTRLNDYSQLSPELQ